ncbi:hypothetical protein UB44_18595 [Burkholderiaceae bacterium 26]|nr:hypothetical protein UB44_18595 [Burkholderiaceae bacterium 26]
MRAPPIRFGPRRFLFSCRFVTKFSWFFAKIRPRKRFSRARAAHMHGWPEAFARPHRIDRKPQCFRPRKRCSRLRCRHA